MFLLWVFFWLKITQLNRCSLNITEISFQSLILSCKSHITQFCYLKCLFQFWNTQITSELSLSKHQTELLLKYQNDNKTIIKSWCSGSPKLLLSKGNKYYWREIVLRFIWFYDLFVYFFMILTKKPIIKILDQLTSTLTSVISNYNFSFPSSSTCFCFNLLLLQLTAVLLNCLLW